MDSPTQPTFIPHEAVTSGGIRRAGGGLAELFILVAILLFVISAALGVGVFLYTQYLQSSNASKLSQLNAAEASFDPSLIQQLTRLDTRMSAAQSLLSAHLAPSDIFAMLQASTVQDISFSALQLDASDRQHIRLTMTGVAASVNSIALQAQVFSQSGLIQSPIFSNIGAEPNGVNFNFSGLVNPTSISYESFVSGANAAQLPAQQTQTPAAAQVAPAFEGTSTPAAQPGTSQH
jgi:hypothetical protein